MKIERMLKKKAQEHINSLVPWMKGRLYKKRIQLNKFKELMKSRSPFVKTTGSELRDQIWDMMTHRLYFYLLGRRLIKRPLGESFSIWWRRFWRLG
jgi:hypothetical protein